MRTGQATALRKAGCVTVIDLDEHKLSDVLRLARANRTFVLAYASFLIPATRRGRWTEFETALDVIRGKSGAVQDLHTGLTSREPHNAAFRAVVRDQIKRDKQGLAAEVVGKGNRGRQLVVFTAQQTREAKAIWRDMIEYPTWHTATVALHDIRSAKDEPFTKARAFRLWGPRTSKR